MSGEIRGRRIVLRERNERGFALFLQNLKSIINLLTHVEERPLETEILIETRHYLLNANGTLSLLLNNVSRGGENPTGLPSHHLHLPVETLKLSLRQLINLLSIMIENCNADFEDKLGTCYSSPSNTVREGPGRKRFEISKDQLEHLRSFIFHRRK